MMQTVPCTVVRHQQFRGPQAKCVAQTPSTHEHKTRTPGTHTHTNTKQQGTPLDGARQFLLCRSTHARDPTQVAPVVQNPHLTISNPNPTHSTCLENHLVGRCYAAAAATQTHSQLQPPLFPPLPHCPHSHPSKGAPCAALRRPRSTRSLCRARWLRLEPSTVNTHSSTL